MVYNRTQRQRKDAGRCIACGESASRGLLCGPCADKRSATQAARVSDRIGQNLCVSCGNPVQQCRRKCASCLSRDIGYRKSMIERWRSEGLCLGCGQTTPLPSKVDSDYPVCERCYLEKASREAFGASRHWRILRQKMIDQGNRCPYTGDILVLGINDAVDHIAPTRHFPERRTDPNNVEWVTREVNEMKRDRTPEEFLDLIQRILSYRTAVRS